MQRSKLEIYIAILKALAQKGPLKLTHIIYQTNINCTVLKQYLNFLITQRLIEEKLITKRKVVYTNTPKGIAVLAYFKELSTALPIIEEKDKKSPLPYNNKFLSHK